MLEKQKLYIIECLLQITYGKEESAVRLFLSQKLRCAEFVGTVQDNDYGRFQVSVGAYAVSIITIIL